MAKKFLAALVLLFVVGAVQAQAMGSAAYLRRDDSGGGGNTRYINP